jgi:hypothetical protein
MMHRRLDDVPPVELALDGKKYASVEQWQRAKDARDDWRARILARVSVEAGDLLTDSAVVAVEAARRYCDQLAPFWSAGPGWRDPPIEDLERRSASARHSA